MDHWQENFEWSEVEQAENVKKYAFKASEIMGCDCPELFGAIRRDSETQKASSSPKLSLVDDLFSFLMKPQSSLYYSTQASYFSRAIKGFSRVEPAHVLSFVLSSGGMVLGSILAKLEEPAIAQVLYSVISFEKNEQCSGENSSESSSRHSSLFTQYTESLEKAQGMVKEREQVLRLTLEKMKASSCLSTVQGASWVICEVLSNFQKLIEGKTLLEAFFDKETLKELFVKMISFEDHFSESVCDILLSWIAFLKGTTALEDQINSFQATFATYLPSIMGQATGFGSSFIENKSFGAKRLKMLKMIRESFEVGSLNEATQNLDPQETLTALLQVILQFPWSSICHKEVLRIFEYIATKKESLLGQYVRTPTFSLYFSMRTTDAQ